MLKSYPYDKYNVELLRTLPLVEKSFKMKYYPRDLNVENISSLLNDDIVNSTFLVSFTNENRDSDHEKPS